MTPKQEKIVESFKLVRPELSTEKIMSLSQDEMKAWDSILLVTLFTLLEDEFKIKFETSEYQKLLSFEAIEKRLT